MEEVKMQAVRTFETRNNTYSIAYGYKVTAKTTYEQRLEQRQERLYMIKQKLCGVGLLAVGVIGTIIGKDASLMVVLVPASTYVMATKDHVIG
jgi:hypothetical protein